MRFASPTAAARVPAVLPLLGVAMVPAVLVLALACVSMNRAEETVRIPAGIVARPPAVRESPIISVQLDREGVLTVGGQVVSANDRATVWQRERGAVVLLGYEPAQATVVLHADADVSTESVQQVIEQAQQAGFAKCVLRSAEEP